MTKHFKDKRADASKQKLTVGALTAGTIVNTVQGPVNFRKERDGEETSERTLLYKILQAQGVLLTELNDLRGEIEDIKNQLKI